MNEPKHRILVVEDETELRESIRDALELNGYEVYAACDGQEALEMLERDTPLCMVLLDLVMPRMDGWEFCARLRALPTYLDVPVLIHSSSDLPPPGGATRVFEKPLTFTRLLDVVAEHCSPPTAS